MKKLIYILFAFFSFISCRQSQIEPIHSFDKEWKFFLGNDSLAAFQGFDDSSWRILNLPHDWSIEGEFGENEPATPDGGALPTGIGWYRKSFQIENYSVDKKYYIDFDGVFCNSEVWINNHYLGKRPNGYISFRYDLSPYLKADGSENLLAVKVDNSAQPASRFYTGSGIYRHVWLVAKNKIHIDYCGTFVTTPQIDSLAAQVNLEIKIRNEAQTGKKLSIQTLIIDPSGNTVAGAKQACILTDSIMGQSQQFIIDNPKLWSVETPHLYKAVSTLSVDGHLIDSYETPFGIRSFAFNPKTGFSLNGKSMKIYGVNQHHDLGALGAAVNIRAMERQLEILKKMGCNAIRLAHNPHAPELLDLCDRMGFLVIGEAFDEWKRTKVKMGYHLYWDEWHVRDLQDQVLRDRNHPSIIAWSIGNEIPEQFDSTGIALGKELSDIVKSLDTTRLVTCALTENVPEKNFIYQSGGLGLLGFNYKHRAYTDFPNRFPGENFLPSENMSALSTRGHYDLPSDSMRVWPPAYNAPFKGNDDLTASAYDNAYTYWGATHEETWNTIKSNDFIPGMFIWAGFDYLGEPLPYPYPARSTYLGIIDLCGFPKDMYYLYQSEWNDKTMLHLFPHWNWKEGQTVDVWVYYNNADEVELFMNGESQGVCAKEAGKFHTMWRLKFVPGTIRAVSRKDGQTVMDKEIHTAGAPARVELSSDRTEIHADGSDLSFITVRILDEAGNMVPDASNLVNFSVTGNGTIAGVDNGYQASLEPFKASCRKAFNGMCLLIVQSTEQSGKINIIASSEGLKSAEMQIQTIK